MYLSQQTELSSVAHIRYLESGLDLELFYCLTVNIVDVIKVKNLLDFCENLENLLENPKVLQPLCYNHFYLCVP